LRARGRVARTLRDDDGDRVVHSWTVGARAIRGDCRSRAIAAVQWRRVSATLDSTPAADGYRMPGEFEPHAGCWMAWPERPDNWRLGAKPAQTAFAQVAEAIAASEPVTMAVSDAQFEHCRGLLSDAIRVVEVSTDDAWMRDIGPTFVTQEAGRRRGVDWRFNAWGGLRGGLYFPWDRDDRVAQKVLEIERAERYRAPIVLEGGAIHSDGEGTLLTTEECLLNPNRNPELDRALLEQALCDYVGAEKVIWLGRGLPGDETGGHVDNLACFVRAGVVLLTYTDDASDPQHEISRDALERLQAARDARGRSLEVIRVRSPPPLTITAEEAEGVDAVAGTQPRHAGDRIPASYVNFYLASTRVVLPLLDESYDEEAVAVLRECFPDREVVGVPAREILLGGGNVHCITQQVPATGDA
jgi:agmatine deiminase